jgi:predicted secreted Zn-dependent protease
VQHRCKDGMHYDALIHREITTHIARYIACGLNKNLPELKNEDNDALCYDIIQSIIDKIDYQITSFDKKIIEKYRPMKFNFDMMENLNEKEKDILYLIDYYENNCLE